MFCLLGFLIRITLINYLGLDLNNLTEYFLACLPAALGVMLAEAIMQNIYFMDGPNPNGNAIGNQVAAVGQAATVGPVDTGGQVVPSPPITPGTPVRPGTPVTPGAQVVGSPPVTPGPSTTPGAQVVAGTPVAAVNPLLSPNHPTNLDRSFVGPRTFSGAGGLELANPDRPPFYRFVINPNGDYLVKDRDGIAIRGYAPRNSGLTNQPYARNLAAAMQDQHDKGMPRRFNKLVHLSDNDRRFLKDSIEDHFFGLQGPHNSILQRRFLRNL